ncbi:MAG: lytic transglycosylase domain-containing protein, partial [Bacteroidota bacterium]
IPDKLDFAGEEVPVHHYDVYESIDREFLVNVYWQSQTMLFIKRANKYFPVIEPILKDNGIPDDFKYLALTESGLHNVVSPAGATGYWQFLKGTGKEYGLEISDEVDERYDLEKSTIAACKYFHEAYAKYKNWTMVAASYNMGMGGADKQIEKQKVSDYHDLLLNNETARYVYRIIAIKTILSNPEDYGFHFRDKDLYQPVPTFDVEIDSAITDFVDFAKKYNINYKILKEFNPWLRQSFLTNKEKKKYVIRIPVEGFRSFQKAYEYNRPDSVATDTL